MLLLYHLRYAKQTDSQFIWKNIYKNSCEDFHIYRPWAPAQMKVSKWTSTWVKGITCLYRLFTPTSCILECTVMECLLSSSLALFLMKQGTISIGATLHLCSNLAPPPTPTNGSHCYCPKARKKSQGCCPKARKTRKDDINDWAATAVTLLSLPRKWDKSIMEKTFQHHCSWRQVEVVWMSNFCRLRLLAHLKKEAIMMEFSLRNGNSHFEKYLSWIVSEVAYS